MVNKVLFVDVQKASLVSFTFFPVNITFSHTPPLAKHLEEESHLYKIALITKIKMSY